MEKLYKKQEKIFTKQIADMYYPEGSEMPGVHARYMIGRMKIEHLDWPIKRDAWIRKMEGLKKDSWVERVRPSTPTKIKKGR